MRLTHVCHSLLLFFLLPFLGSAIDALWYDSSAGIECLVDPEKPQYGGGITVNPDFNHGLDGWIVYGTGRVKERVSKEGNKFIAAISRSLPSDSFSQKLHLEKGMLYSFSAWVQISKGRERVSGQFKTSDWQIIHGGTVIAQSGCWSMLKGGFVANISGPVDLYFGCKNTAVEIWVDSVSLQPFTKQEWRSHQDESIEQMRKRIVQFQATDANGNAAEGATVTIKQTKSSFPFGCAMTQNILTSTSYQAWFSSRFKFTTFANEMKWYDTEDQRGRENYSLADAMLAFAKQHGISVRGHNVFWDDPKYQPWWVKNLPLAELKRATKKRIQSVMSRYRGQVIAWDVVNENLHSSFFEDRLGPNASAAFYLRAQQLDPKTTLFMNDYNTVEEQIDPTGRPDNYLQKLRQIRSFPGNEQMLVGIGLESHFKSGQPNLPYMRSALDKIGAARFPVWLTEVDIAKDPNQARYLEEILREGYSHPSIRGIIIWSGPQIDGCERMCLTDYNFKNTQVGDVVDKLISEWRTEKVERTTNSSGSFEVSLFHGEYEATITNPVTNQTTLIFQVENGSLEIAKRVQKVHIHV